MNKLIPLLLAALATAAGAQTQSASYTEHPEAAALVAKLESEHGLDPQWVRDRLAAAERQPDVLEAMRKPAEKTLAWHEYRRIFLKPRRIAGGARFVREHADTFKHAQSRYGVPPAVIAAIIGVETRYGDVTGDDRVLDTLATLGFDYPERADFFRSELGEFLVLAREEGINPDSMKGSYAGAMGLPQFIPSSYRAYAVDFNDNGRRDLSAEPADAIGSVANYLAEHGWQTDRDVILRARTNTGGDDLERSRRKTRYPYRRLAAAGIEAESPQTPAPDTQVGLVELEGTDGPQYWIGLNNFFVITDYNHSPLYAMAVYQLSEAIADKLDGDQGAAAR